MKGAEGDRSPVGPVGSAGPGGRVWPEWLRCVPAAYCICLAEREDRAAEARTVFADFGLSGLVEFYRPKKDKRGGKRGCWESHRAVAQLALKAGHRCALVFEDDVVFRPTMTREVVGDLADVMSRSLPQDFNILHIGNFPLLGLPVDSKMKLWRTRSLALHAYIISRQMMGLMAAAAFDDVQFKWSPGWRDIDRWTMTQRGMYSLFPMMCYQRYEQVTDNPFSKHALIENGKRLALSPKALPAFERGAYFGLPILTVVLFIVLIAAFLSVGKRLRLKNQAAAAVLVDE